MTTPLSISDAIARIADAYPPRDRAATLDTVKCGDPSQTLRGVVSCFIPTRKILDEALRLEANLIISHEPTFYGHLDETQWLENDPVYRAKRSFLDVHGMVVWRFHDGTHVVQPDAIKEGMIGALGWSGKQVPEQAFVYEIGPVTVEELAQQMKAKLGIASVKIAGDPAMICNRVGLKVGSPGGRAQITLLSTPDVDVVATGESPEWETCEYVRDAAAAGLNKALIVLGHANSEEAGVEWVTDRIRELLPSEVPVTFLKAGDPFVFV